MERTERVTTKSINVILVVLFVFSCQKNTKVRVSPIMELTNFFNGTAKLCV